MNNEEANTIMQCDGSERVSLVKRKFRELAWAAHPDQPTGSVAAMQKLAEAYALVLGAAEAAACPGCNGTGRSSVQKSGFYTLSVQCAQCEGGGRRG